MDSSTYTPPSRLHQPVTSRTLLAQLWPPSRVRASGPRVELRMPDERELLQLAVAARDAPDRLEVEGRCAGEHLLRWHWGQRGAWKTDDWTFLLVAFVDGQPVGIQDMRGAAFADSREVSSGSWLAPGYRGRGIGTEMRHVMLAIAFDGFNAQTATSDAPRDNTASIRVSEKCGYVMTDRNCGFDGAARRVFRLTHEAWVQEDRPPVTLNGIDSDVLRMIGVA